MYEFFTIEYDIILMTLIATYNAYHVGSASPLDEQQLVRLSRIFNRNLPMVSSTLEGRRGVSFHHIDGWGPVAVKHYARGGLIRHLITQTYLRWGKTRGRVEYELLQVVSRLGVKVPEPLAYAYRGRLFYRAWLVTREIPQSITLARLSLTDEKRARRVMKAAVEQVSRLIDNDILHVDLHPGNVIVDRNDRVFLVDFDKGRRFRGSRKKLNAYYLARWQRAVAKHRLPAMLGELIRTGIDEGLNPLQ